jgi:hypothetical protein
MKRTMSPAMPGGASTPAGTYNLRTVRKLGPTRRPVAAESPPDVFTRVNLELLDEYTCEKRGYDPYDTVRNRSTPDIWVNKRKRA